MVWDLRSIKMIEFLASKGGMMSPVSERSANKYPAEFNFRVRFQEEDEALDFKAQSKQEMVDWLMAIDGLCMRNLGSHMEPEQKVSPFFRA